MALVFTGQYHVMPSPFTFATMTNRQTTATSRAEEGKQESVVPPKNNLEPARRWTAHYQVAVYILGIPIRFTKMRGKNIIEMRIYVGYSEIKVRWAVKKKQGKIFYYIQKVSYIIRLLLDIITL